MTTNEKLLGSIETASVAGEAAESHFHIGGVGRCTYFAVRGKRADVHIRTEEGYAEAEAKAQNRGL